MAEFNVGDKVTHAGYNGLLTVQAVARDGGGRTYLVLRAEGSLQKINLYADECTPQHVKPAGSLITW